MGEQRTALILLLILCVAISTLPLVGASENSWTTLEPMPTPRASFGVAVVEGKIYAIGGGTDTIVGTNEMYDPATDMWTTKQPMPTPRHSFGIAVYQNKIYVVGGIIGESSPDYSGYTGVNEVYDPLTDTWETMEPMLTPRSQLQANVVSDKIYLIAGTKYVDLFPFYTGASGLNEVYDPLTDSWSTKTRAPIDISLYPSAVVDNKIYLIGAGLDANIPTQIYEPETDTWSSGESVLTTSLAAAGGATTGVLAPKRVYVFGGNYEYNDAMNLTQVYNPETDTWTNGTEMPTPRWSLGVAVLNDELYAIGGYNGENGLAVNEKYTPADYIPEFPSWIILPLFFTATLVVILYRNRLRRRIH
jgi:N-acetylneuraminic acid mutarotase